jgi:hypothetical protein
MNNQEIINEYGECTRDQMLEYLKKAQALQRKAAGKMTVWVNTSNDSGAIFGGIVREAQISIDLTIMNVFGDDDYNKNWSLYQFYPLNKNEKIFTDFKKTLEQLVKDFDKEWNRRRTAYINRHGRDCV